MDQRIRFCITRDLCGAIVGLVARVCARADPEVSEEEDLADGDGRS